MNKNNFDNIKDLKTDPYVCEKYSYLLSILPKDNLIVLILVGSFSRGEGIKGLSDIEFWAVVKDLAKAKKLKLDGNVSLGFTTRNHLKRLKPYIYTVEVKSFGKVVYGDGSILNLIPDYSYEDISPVDGFILLNNRLVEQLVLLNKIENKQEINKYDFDKSYIQLVNSLLVLNSKYRSLYQEKLEEFRKIENIEEGLRSKVEDAFASIKHQQGEIASPSARNDINREEAFKKWREVRGYFRSVWLEEMKVFGGIKYWLNALSLGKLLQFWVYRRASKLYFSNDYRNSGARNRVIKDWERFVK